VQPFGATIAQHATMNALLQELTAYLGGAFSHNTVADDAGDSERGWIEDQNIRWNDTFFLSGSTVAVADTDSESDAYTNVQRVWRLTCAQCNWANCTATSSVTALKNCAKEVGSTVQTVPVGLWLYGIGTAPCTLTFQRAWICPPHQSPTNSDGRKCPKLGAEAASRQSDFGSWILQDSSGNVSVSCAWENASRLLGPDGTTTWPLPAAAATAAIKSDDTPQLPRATIFQRDSQWDCHRSPSLVLAGDSTLVALAVARNWVGDGCAWTNPPPSRNGTLSSHVSKRSTSNGRSWDSRPMAVAAGNDFATVFDGVTKSILVHYCSAPPGTPFEVAKGNVCFAHGVQWQVVSRDLGRTSEAPTQLESFLGLGGILVGPGVELQLRQSGRLLYCGHQNLNSFVGRLTTTGTVGESRRSFPSSTSASSPRFRTAPLSSTHAISTAPSTKDLSRTCLSSLPFAPSYRGALQLSALAPLLKPLS
jgi:hypothetical protein